MKAALIGYKGFVGRALYTVLKDAGYEVIGVDRENYSQNQADNYDILINSAMPSKRFLALKNPGEDFHNTVGLTADLLYNWKYKKFVQISSVSARCQLDHPYGIHKAAAEMLVKHSSAQNLIIRLGALYGPGLDKGSIFDILNNKPLFFSGDCKYNYISTKAAAEIITSSLDQTGIKEVGAIDQISLKEIAEHFNLQIQFGEKLESQNTESPDSSYPHAGDVLRFMQEVKQNE